MATVYRIRDWDKHFETSETRKYKSLRYVAVPNKLDGDGYTQLVTDHHDGALHYAAWVGILLVASKCSPRGTLIRGTGQPYDAAALARVTRLPASIFESAIQRLTEEIGWLEIIDMEAVKEPASAADVPCQATPPTFREPLPVEQETVPILPTNYRPTRPEEPTKTIYKPAPVVGGGISKTGNGSVGVMTRDPFWPLDAIKTAHLKSDDALEALSQKLMQTLPEVFSSPEESLLLIFGAAERAMEVGNKPIRLFVSIVRELRWGLVDDGQKARAMNRLQSFRQRQGTSK